jgi:hypothetical protein
MAYQAMTFRVVVATPGDVPEERRIIREVVLDWNSAHSEKERMVLLPIGWETDTTPETGDRPQAIVNSQMIKSADLLIAAFWTRLGTPTGTSPSGTVEEIQEMLAAGKPVMIYFSKQPVVLDSVDQEQYGALKEFKQWCRENALFREYLDIAEFQRNLARDLAIQVNKNATFGQRSSSYAFVASGTVGRVDPIETLSPEARMLLDKASADKNGMILRSKTMGGLILQVGGQNLVPEADARAEATWLSALDELVKLELIRSMGPKNELYQLTRKGYEISDRLRAESK